MIMIYKKTMLIIVSLIVLIQISGYAAPEMNKAKMDNADMDDTSFDDAGTDETGVSDTENEKSIRSEYSDTLEYGIDSSVIETIKTLEDLHIQGFEKQVLQRMEESKNEELITEGIAYMRALSYEDKAMIDFSLSLIEAYDDQSRKAVQFATFYIGEHSDLLTENDIDFLQTIILDIIDTDIPSIALAVLELLPSIYSESDIAYISQDPDMTKDSAENQKNETSAPDIPKNEDSMGEGEESSSKTDMDTQISSSEKMKQSLSSNLYSTQLKTKYDEINTPIIQNQIISVLGEIKAYNQIDFILEIAEDDNVSNSNKGVAIKALTNFDAVSSDIYEKIDALLKVERHNKVPEIRVSIIEALETIAINTKNETYVLWIKEGLRDQEQNVRKQSLDSLSNIYEQDSSIASQDIVFSAVKYMVTNDPESSVKKAAMRTISLLDGGVAYLISQIDAVRYSSPDTKGLIDIGVGDIAEKGGVKAIEALAKRSIEKKNDSLLEYIAGAMAKQSKDNFTVLVGILLRYTNNSVLLSCLTTIGRNNISAYNTQLVALSTDITQSSGIRNKAKEVLSLNK